MNQGFRRDYDEIFRKDPMAANLLLLLAELSDARGQVQTTEAELADLMNARFHDPRAYQLPGEPPQ